MGKFLNVLEIQQLEGGTYDINTVLNIIKQITSWAIVIGVSVAGATLAISFVTLVMVDVDQKQRVKERIKQILWGLAGIIMAVSLVNIMIRLFT